MARVAQAITATTLIACGLIGDRGDGSAARGRDSIDACNAILSWDVEPFRGRIDAAREWGVTTPCGAVCRVDTHSESGEFDGWERVEYDDRDRPLRWERSDGLWLSFEYFEGELVVVHQSDADRTDLYYDDDGRVTRTISGDAWTTLTYDGPGRVVRRDTSDGSWLSYSYDDSGRLRRTDDSRGAWMTVAYDGGGRRTRQEFSDGTRFLFTYDGEDRLTRVDVTMDGDDYWETFQYDGNGRLTRVDTALDTWSVFSYDADHRLARADSGGLSWDVYSYDGCH